MVSQRGAVVVVLALLLLTSASLLGSVAGQQLGIQLGANVPPLVQARLVTLLTSVAPYPVVHLPADAVDLGLDAGSLLFSVGNTSVSRALIPPAELEGAGPEGYVVKRSSGAGFGNGIVVNASTVWVGDGNVMRDSRFVYTAPGSGVPSSIGAGYAAYRALELAGFAFLHAMAPFVPSSLSSGDASDDDLVTVLAGSPRWHERLWHVHTQHPLELTDLLQGFDIEAVDGTGYAGETWESMLPGFETFIEWTVANLQNRVEWLLLLSPAWREYGKSEARKERFRVLLEVCRGFAMPCGVDVPIALQQQHSWTMIGDTREGSGDDTDPIVNMHANIDWWMDAGFAFLTTESGYSEFTKGNCSDMLAWMNEATRYLSDTYDRELHIKVHVSQGQVCDEYPDPRTGEPINFNFLPIYADPRLVVSPHTVQFYAYDEPAPTYGNTDFDFMYQFMFDEVRKGERGVMWYPESQYWISFDASVPLFLPIYAYNRLRDLRHIARQEDAMGPGKHIQGQTLFESGWEWGTWFSNVIAARAAYDPLLSVGADAGDDDAAFVALVQSVLAPPFGPAVAAQLADVLLDYSKTQKAVLIEGRIDGGEPPSDIVKRNGQAYIEGWDTFADIGSMFTSFLVTQPVRLSLRDFRPRGPNQTVVPDYRSEVKPLLQEMETQFDRLLAQLQALRSAVSPLALPIFMDLYDSAQVTAARATQIHALYDYASTWKQGSLPSRQARLRDANAAFDVAAAAIEQRQAEYKVPLQRIAGWRPNPTVYEHTYLWTVKSMAFFHRDRDIAMAESRDVMSPCYMNYLSPVKVAFGDAALQQLMEDLRAWADETRPGNHFLIDCTTAPAVEPVYPLQNHPRPAIP